MVTHYSVLAWRIPGTGEPGGLLSMGSHRVGHDWSNLAAAAAASQKNWAENTKSSHTPHGHIYAQPHLLPTSHPSGTSAMLRNRHWRIVITPGPQFSSGLILCIPWVLDKCIMACVHHDSVTQSWFIALKILCSLPVHPSLPATPGHHWSVYCLHSFAFTRTSQSWNHTMRSLFRLSSFT